MSRAVASIYGRAGAPPELKGEGKARRAHLSLAVEQGSRQASDVVWYRVTMWGGLGEAAAKAVQKGDRVYVSGQLVVHRWKDETGAPRWGLEVNAHTVDWS